MLRNFACTWLAAVLMLLGACSGALAQGRVRVFLMTMGPGEEVWTRFGHNAIWIHDEQQGTDLAYNYGMFSFEQGFLGRFIRGDLRYWVQAFDAGETIDDYQAWDRTLRVAELNLSEQQARLLQKFLAWNARPENRFYLYDYYRDNCSTRVRDVLDTSLGGQIKAQTQQRAGRTYRDHTRAAMSTSPIVYTGLQFILGQPVDRELSVWEQMFLPMELHEALRQVKVVDADGQQAPLVISDRLLYQSRHNPPIPPAPPRWWPAYLATGILWGAGIMLAGVRLPRVGMVAAVTWALLCGGAGLFLIWGWTCTGHWSVRANENILHFSPLAALLIVALPLVRRRKWIWQAALLVAMAVALSSILGVVLKLLPAFCQANGEMIALALPIHLGLVGWLWRSGKKIDWSNHATGP